MGYMLIIHVFVKSRNWYKILIRVKTYCVCVLESAILKECWKIDSGLKGNINYLKTKNMQWV